MRSLFAKALPLAVVCCSSGSLLAATPAAVPAPAFDPAALVSPANLCPAAPSAPLPMTILSLCCDRCQTQFDNCTPPPPPPISNLTFCNRQYTACISPCGGFSACGPPF